MRSPWKRLNPTEPSSGCEELSIGLPWIMSVGHNKWKQTEPNGGVSLGGVAGDPNGEKQGLDVGEGLWQGRNTC